MTYNIIETGDKKCLTSPDVNYYFCKRTGFMALWGSKPDIDPDWCPYGPTIADIEITTICKGPGGKLCKFCYKSNNPNGAYMTFDTFRAIFDKLPDTLTQIAFGVDAQCESNPDVWKIMDYCRENRVIPNVTVADITDDTADRLARVCGAVAVSRYDDKDLCYNTVKKLTDRGMEQVNIHQMVSMETLDITTETMYDIIDDPRLAKLNAIVFLSLKQKGRGEGFTPLTTKDFNEMVSLCLKFKLRFGFDSCSAMKFLKCMELDPDYEKYKTLAEPCESARFSAYINVYGEYYPCSFTEDKDGPRVVDYDDFMDIWNSDSNKIFRLTALDYISKGKGCQEFDI